VERAFRGWTVAEEAADDAAARHGTWYRLTRP
jgi:hypothetical protein